MHNDFLKVMLVTKKNDQDVDSYLSFIETCINSGITAVQLREKNLSYDELFSFGQSLKKTLDKNNIPLIINDQVDLCLDLNASGVHLGQSDDSILLARKKLGSEKIIGMSVNSIKEIEGSRFLPVDYIGIGSIFPTKNKSNVQTVWGVESLKKAVQLSFHSTIAIGGISKENIQSVVATSVDGVAAIGAFHDTKNPFETIKIFKNHLKKC
jgi:thiamine-phosphate pyrophosphorylase